jgi:4-hydroxybenzoate polyprenyltransferase
MNETLAGAKATVIPILIFLGGYIAGELDGLWFLLAIVVAAGAFFYRRYKLVERRDAGLSPAV